MLDPPSGWLQEYIYTQVHNLTPKTDLNKNIFSFPKNNHQNLKLTGNISDRKENISDRKVFCSSSFFRFRTERKRFRSERKFFKTSGVVSDRKEMFSVRKIFSLLHWTCFGPKINIFGPKGKIPIFFILFRSEKKYFRSEMFSSNLHFFAPDFARFAPDSSCTCSHDQTTAVPCNLTLN